MAGAAAAMELLVGFDQESEVVGEKRGLLSWGKLSHAETRDRQVAVRGLQMMGPVPKCLLCLARLEW